MNKNLNYQASVRSSQENPCPICGDEKTSCKLFARDVLCFKSSLSEGLTGWTNHRSLGRGMGVWWKLNEDQEDLELLNLTQRARQPQGFQKKSKSKANGKGRLYTTGQVSEIYKTAIELCSKEFNQNWVKSGKTSQAQLSYGVRVLSQAAARYLAEKQIIPFEHVKGYTGCLFIPALGATGQIEGAQIRFLPGRSEVRYVWLSNKGVHDYSNAYGESPFQVLPTSSISNSVLFVEGLLKPINAHIAAGSETNIIGCAGGQWGYNPNTLKDAVRVFQARGVNKWLLAADQAYKTDPHVVRRYDALQEMLKSEFDIELEVLDWGQCDAEKGSGLDVDEVSPSLLKQSILSVTGKFSLDHEKKLLVQALPAPTFYKPFQTGGVDYQNPSDDEFMTLLRNHDFLLDSRPTGYGKTHNIEKIFYENPEYHVVYLSKSPRNPTTSFLETHAHIAVTRYAGTINTPEKSPLGNPKTRSITANETPDNPGTCTQIARHLAARKSGIPAKKVCGQCPLKERCASGNDPENNYLFHLKNEKPDTRRLISVSPSAVSERLFSDTRTNLVIIDEFADLFPPNSHSVVAFSEFTTLQERLGDVGASVKLSSVDSQGRQYVLVEGGDNIEEYLEECDLKSQEEALARFRYSDNVGNVTRNLHLYQKIKNQTLYRKNSLFIINEINQDLANILSLADKILILDATTTKSELSARGFKDVVVVSADNKAVNTQKIKVYGVEGFNTFNWFKNDRSKEVYEALRSQVQGENVTFALPCGIKRDEDIGFYSNSRGTNNFARQTIYQVGMPSPNLGAIQLEYEVLQQPTFTFQDYYQKRVMDETLQSIGRQRAHRYDEPMDYHIIGNVRLEYLEALGFKVEYSALCSILPVAHTPATKSLSDLILSIRLSGARTLTSLANSVGRSVSSVSRSLKRIKLTLEEIIERISSEVPKAILWANISPELVEELKSWDGVKTLSEEAIGAIERNIFRTGCAGMPLKTWNFVRNTFVAENSLRLNVFDLCFHKVLSVDRELWGLSGESLSEFITESDLQYALDIL